MIDLFGIQKAQREAESAAFARGFAAKVTAAKDETQIYAVLGPAEAPEFLDACTDLAKLGLGAYQLRKIAHALQFNRILAFGFGDVTDLGEAGRWLDGRTRGSSPYEEDEA
ncbi:hypothetical protein [Arthrobacter sp. JSM 101049]|uniref:hypothetical protein n=1 Tax=Arthrobacter sp. JSM 101049 TaxID=929097 RepID=UPI00356B221B